MAFWNAMKGMLNPMNAPGMKQGAQLMGKLPGMQKLGQMPGMQTMSKFTPGMKGMFNPQKGLGPSAPPMPVGNMGMDARPEMMPAEGGEMMPPPQMQPQVQPQPQQRSRFAQQMMPRNKQQFMRGLNPFNMMR